MFVRADRMLEPPPGSGDHLVGYRWEGFKPLLSTYQGASGRLEDHPLGDIDLTLSKVKTCVGRFDGEDYTPCPRVAEVRGFSQCRECASTWIPIQECVFEPRCGGEICGCEFCSREHIVYAAFLGRRVKVGMTSSRRLKIRGIEQGADAIAPLVDCENRMEARRMENALSRKIGIPQRVTQKQALNAIAHPSVRGEVMTRYREILARAGELCSRTDEEVIFLDEYPMERMDSVPRLTPTESAHKGELMGAKGRFVIYSSNGSLRAVNMSDAVARWTIPSGTPDR